MSIFFMILFKKNTNALLKPFRRSSTASPSSVYIFIGGDAPNNNIISWTPDCVIIADAGFDTCKRWNMIPNIVVGDFDSVSVEEVREYAPDAIILPYNCNKDDTDTTIALSLAYEHKYSDISIIGGIGQRIDHFIAILGLFRKKIYPNRVLGPKYQLEYVVPKCTSIIDTTHIPDKYISFFPVSSYTIQYSNGLRWNLDNIILNRERASVSNEYISDKVSITMKRGALMGAWRHGDTPQRPHVII